MSGHRSIVLVAVLGVVGVALAPPSTAEPGWISDVATLTTRVSASQYDVVLTPDGNAVATWVEATATNFLLMSSRRPPGGTWSTPAQVDIRSETQDAEPATAVDGEGHVVAVWRDFLTGRSGSVIRAATSDGATWSPSQDLSPTGTHAFEPEVATDARGDAAVVWTQDASGGAGRIVAAAYRAAGQRGWAISDLATTPGAGKATVAVDADGRAIAVWGQGGRVLTADRTPAAGAWSAPRVLSNSPGHEPKVIVDADDRTTAAWTYGDVSGLSGVESATRAMGADWDPTTTLSRSSSELAWQLDLGVNVTGEAVAAWVTSGDGNRRSDLDTATWAPGGTWTVTRIDSPQVYNSSPKIGFGAGRSSVIMWTGSTEQLTASRTLYAITRTVGRAWSKPTSLASGSVSGPRVAVDPAGHGTLLWEEAGGLLRSQVFDGVAPTIRKFDRTTFARRGERVSYSARARDAWSTPSVTWQFDHHAPVAGDRVTRTFQAPGVHRIRLTATDQAQNQATRHGVTIVASRHPRLRDVSLSRSVIRISGPRAVRQTRLSFRPGAPARVHVRFVDRSGATVATVAKAVEAGHRALILTASRLDLGRGRYTVRVMARNALGATAAPRVPLRIRS